MQVIPNRHISLDELCLTLEQLYPYAGRCNHFIADGPDPVPNFWLILQFSRGHDNKELFYLEATNPADRTWQFLSKGHTYYMRLNTNFYTIPHSKTLTAVQLKLSLLGLKITQPDSQEKMHAYYDRERHRNLQWLPVIPQDFAQVIEDDEPPAR